MIELVPVRWPWQALKMAQIRNTCRDFMTRNTSYIGPVQQLRWWWGTRHDPAIEPYLFCVGNRPIGYGLVRRVNNKHFVTGGLKPESRNLGLGRPLFEALIERTGTPVYLEVLRSNTRARRLYYKLGFVDIRDLGPRTVLMRKP